MATLDKLLNALVEHRMDALVLEPDRLPRLRRGGQDREVTKAPLPADAIERLLAEVALDGAPATGPWTFEYRLGPTTFRFEAAREGSGWQALARPVEPGSVEPDVTPSPPAESAGGEPLPHLDVLLRDMIERDASDLHVSSEQPVYLRIDGELEAEPRWAAPTPEQLEKRLFEIAPDRHREEFEETGDTDFGYEIRGLARFRINYYNDRRGITAAFRQIPTKIPEVDDLGLPDVLRKVTDLSKGLILVTGPTGSGKSTTLAALLNLINTTRPDHIITIEDPIEFIHPSKKCLVHQRQAGLHTHSFAKALRAALREDPDVVMVGEMRDLDTTSIAIQTAETGHLVFGTLHTTSATSTVDRLIDQYPPDQQEQIRLMLAESLKVVVSQVLLKKKGGGRVAAFEVLLCTPAISNMIREGKTFQMKSAMQTGRKIGMTLLNDFLVHLVESDQVEPRDAYLKAAEKDDLINRFKAKNIDTSYVEEDSFT